MLLTLMFVSSSYARVEYHQVTVVDFQHKENTLFSKDKSVAATMELHSR